VTVTALQAKQPIAVDGKLDEAVWQQGRWYTDFKLLSQGEKLAPVQTKFKVAFDGDHLYLGAVALEPQVAALKAKATERDGRVASDDCLEFMVDPTGERTEYYHFIVNSRGTLYDAQMRQGGNVRSVEWNSTAQVAVQVGQDEWTVELRMPFIELGLTGASKGLWAVNVTRERYAGGRQELSSFVPIAGGFHQASLYAQLELPQADLGRFLWVIKQPYEVHITKQDGKLRWTGKTFVENHTGGFKFFLLRAELEGRGGKKTHADQPSGLDNGQKKEYELAVPVEATGRNMLRLMLLDRADPQVTYYVKQFPVSIEYTPIIITLLRPSYRNSIYATQKIDEVLMEIGLSVPKADLQGRSLEVKLVPRGRESAEPISRGRVAKLAPKVEAKLDVRRLPVGDYTIVATVVDKSGKEVFRATKPLRKLPPVEHEWRIDEHNVLRHNGESFLPFGWFSMPPREMAAAKQQGYTAAQDYNMHWRKPPEKKAFLDEVAASGLYVTSYPYPNNRDWMPAPIWGEPLSEERAEELRQYVRRWKTHPAIFAWYMADEPELRPALPERTRRIYEVMAEEDPYHPCIMLNDTIAGIFKYHLGGDILMPDPYPLFVKGGGPAQPISKVAKFTEAVNEATGGRKPAWLTPQAFNYGDAGRKNNRAPTFTELRNMLYQGVAHGAKGFLWYTYSHTSNYPSLRLGMAFLAREVADLKEAILATDAGEVKVEAPQPEEMHCALRQVGRNLFLFAANTSDQEQRVTLQAQGLRGELVVVSEGRTVKARGGKLTDSFAPFASHVYTTDRELAQRPTLAATQQEIDAANAARKRPGNLAFEDRGTKVEVSSKSRYGSTPERVLDGVRGGMIWRDGTRKKFPDWIVVRFAQPEKIGRVVVFSGTLSDFEVQVPEGEGWRTVGAVKAADQEQIEVRFAPLEASAVRLWITGCRDDYSTVSEIEVYAQ